MSPIRISYLSAVLVCAVSATIASGQNNSNPPGSLCLDLRNAGELIAFGLCDTDADCEAPSPDDIMQCSDTDEDAQNGGMCMDQACYDLGEEIVVDLEVGPTTEAVCGLQAFIEYDVESLELVAVQADPEFELGGMDSVFPPFSNPTAGTLDLHIALPLGTPCEQATGATAGGTIARLTFVTVAECKSYVRFRAHNPATTLAGPSGSIGASGCRGEAFPSGTDEIQINETPPVWNCPDSVTVQTDCDSNTADVFFDPLVVTDSCDEMPPPASTCKATYFMACQTNSDCLSYGPCTIEGYCSFPVKPAGIDIDALANGGGTFLAGRTEVFCSATNSCRADALCVFDVVVERSQMAMDDCADADANGIRDDNCMWWNSNECSCVSMATHFADVGGPNGECMPDGTTDSHDRFHVLNCFSNLNSSGDPEYPCEPHPPTAYNVDPGGPFGDCQSDGVCDGNDAMHVLQSFENESMCGCPMDGGGPAPQRPVQRVGGTGLRLELSTPVVGAKDILAVRVFTDGSLADLRAYQLHLATTGGRQGQLELMDIEIELRPDRALGEAVTWSAFNIHSGQMTTGTDGPGRATAKSAYLATFLYRASPDASGTFSIAVRHGDGGRTFLMPSMVRGAIDVLQAPAAKVTVGQRRRR